MFLVSRWQGSFGFVSEKDSCVSFPSRIVFLLGRDCAGACWPFAEIWCHWWLVQESAWLCPADTTPHLSVDTVIIYLLPYPSTLHPFAFLFTSVSTCSYTYHSQHLCNKKSNDATLHCCLWCVWHVTVRCVGLWVCKTGMCLSESLMCLFYFCFTVSIGDFCPQQIQASHPGSCHQDQTNFGMQNLRTFKKQFYFFIFFILSRT